MKVAVDMHLAPVWRRWAVRIALAMVVAIAIGYVPPGLLRRDPRAIKLATQLEQLRAEARTLEVGNAVLARDVYALHNDVRAIEARAREDFAMVYPDEIVMQLRRASAEPPR
jgi:hypothetical protein